MTDSSLTTYAVSIHFSDNVNQIISSTVKSIALATGDDFIIKNKIPPHVTVGAFHSSKNDENVLIQKVKEFSLSQESGTVLFTEIGNFNKRVLFFAPKKNDFLSQINEKLHNLLLPDFEKADNGYYLPEVWFPHTTLATRLNQNNFTEAMKIAAKIDLPLTATVNEIAIYRCQPFEELKIFKLKNKSKFIHN